MHEHSEYKKSQAVEGRGEDAIRFPQRRSYRANMSLQGAVNLVVCIHRFPDNGTSYLEQDSEIRLEVRVSRTLGRALAAVCRTLGRLLRRP